MGTGDGDKLVAQCGVRVGMETDFVWTGGWGGLCGDSVGMGMNYDTLAKLHLCSLTTLYR